MICDCGASLGKSKSIAIDEIVYKENRTKFRAGLKTKAYECKKCGMLVGVAKDLIKSLKSINNSEI